MSKTQDKRPLYLVTVNQGQQIFTADAGEETSILDLLGDKNVVIFAPFPKTFKEFCHEYTEQQRRQEKLVNRNHISGSSCPN